MNKKSSLFWLLICGLIYFPQYHQKYIWISGFLLIYSLFQQLRSFSEFNFPWSFMAPAWGPVLVLALSGYFQPLQYLILTAGLLVSSDQLWPREIKTYRIIQLLLVLLIINQLLFEGNIDHFALMTAGLAVALFWFSPTEQLGLTLTISGIIFFIISFLGSRTGILTIFTGLIAGLTSSPGSWIKQRQKYLEFWGLILTVSLIYSSLSGFLGVKLLRGLDDPNLQTRYLSGTAALSIWRDNFWQGAGPGGFEYQYPSRLYDYLKNNPEKSDYLLKGVATCPHNEFLHIAADTGVIGLLSCLFGFIFWFRIFSPVGVEVPAWLVLISGLIIPALFSVPLHILPAVWIPLLLIFRSSFKISASQTKIQQNLWRAKLSWLAVAAVSLISLSYALSDYFYFEARRSNSSRLLINRSLKFNSSNSKALKTSADLYMSSGDYSAAGRELEKLIRISNNPAVYVALGRWLLANGNLSDARDALDVALAIWPENYSANYYQALWLHLSNRSEEALVFLEKCRELDSVRSDHQKLLFELKKELKKDLKK